MNAAEGTLVRWWRRLAPTAAVRTIRLWRHGPRFAGSFANWGDARARCVGYDEPDGFERIVSAARAVRTGAAAWDRDGALFVEPSANKPLLAALLDVAEHEQGKLALIDFGGALGNTWWQHRSWLSTIVRRWDIVEQAALVKRGRSEFSQPPLRFFETIAAACRDGTPPAILFSGVLQYLPDPFSFLREVSAQKFDHIIFDRLCFTKAGRHRLAIQTNGSILRAKRSYPCWFFDQARFFGECLPGYQCVNEWQGADWSNLPRTAFGGGVLRRITL
jgi:putative methyltransferase (TIGR04325 family)